MTREEMVTQLHEECFVAPDRRTCPGGCACTTCAPPAEVVLMDERHRTVRDGVTSWAKYPDDSYDGLSDRGDVNPICGCHIRQRCTGCGSCTSCDGCYCDEDKEW